MSDTATMPTGQTSRISLTKCTYIQVKVIHAFHWVYPYWPVSTTAKHPPQPSNGLRQTLSSAGYSPVPIQQLEGSVRLTSSAPNGVYVYSIWLNNVSVPGYPEGSQGSRITSQQLVAGNVTTNISEGFVGFDRSRTLWDPARCCGRFHWSMQSDGTVTWEKNNWNCVLCWVISIYTFIYLQA